MKVTRVSVGKLILAISSKLPSKLATHNKKRKKISTDKENSILSTQFQTHFQLGNFGNGQDKQI